jgi:hypothetical protein
MSDLTAEQQHYLNCGVGILGIRKLAAPPASSSADVTVGRSVVFRLARTELFDADVMFSVPAKYPAEPDVWAAVSNFAPQSEWTAQPRSHHAGYVISSFLVDATPEVDVIPSTSFAATTYTPGCIALHEPAFPFRDHYANGIVTTGAIGKRPAMHRRPGWFRAVRLRIEGLLNLRRDWDSYGADRIRPEVAAVTLDLLWQLLADTDDAPEIVPSSDGGLQLEWHAVGGDLEVEISPVGKRSVWFREGQSKQEVEFELEPNDPRSLERLRRLHQAVERPGSVAG